MTLTPTQRTEIRERCAKATAGPWHHRQAGIVRNEQELDWIADKAERGLHHKIIVQRQSLYGGSADYAFISHARTDLPAALDTIGEMGREIANRERRRMEILDFLQEEIGTAWNCPHCKYSTYHANANECAECGALKDLEITHYRLDDPAKAGKPAVEGWKPGPDPMSRPVTRGELVIVLRNIARKWGGYERAWFLGEADELERVK